MGFAFLFSVATKSNQSTPILYVDRNVAMWTPFAHCLRGRGRGKILCKVDTRELTGASVYCLSSPPSCTQ